MARVLAPITFKEFLSNLNVVYFRIRHAPLLESTNLRSCYYRIIVWFFVFEKKHACSFLILLNF